jgi:DNA polymerase-3 subunit epsilon
MLWGLFKRLFGQDASSIAPANLVTPSWLKRLPARVAFFDVETTGLTPADRVVSLAAIGLQTASLATEELQLKYLHLLFDPDRKSHPHAERVHGYSDWALRFQDPFSMYAEEVCHFLAAHELIVAHNAAFDTEFVNRELVLAGLPALRLPTYCTMENYRALGLGGKATLDSVSSRIGLARASARHGAFEDAWLAMNVYLWLNGCPRTYGASPDLPLRPTNIHDVPPPTEGRARPRKRHHRIEAD